MKSFLPGRFNAGFLPALMPFLAILSLTGLVFFVTIQINQVRKIRYSELHAVGLLKSGQITNWLNERISDADYFSTTEEVKTPLLALINGISEKLVSNALDSVFNRMKSNHQYEDILVVNHTGQILYSFNHKPMEIDSHVIQTLHKSKKSGKIELNDFARDSAGTGIRFGLVAPMNLGMGNFHALIFTINPEKFLFPLIENWPIHSRSSESLLIRTEGDSMTCINHLRFSKLPVLSLTLHVRDLGIKTSTRIDDIHADFEAHDYRGVKVLAKVHEIRNIPWRLISKVDKREAFSDLKIRMILITILVALFFFLFYLWMAFVGDRRIRMAIEESHNLLEETSAMAHIGGWTLDPVTQEGTWTAEVARIHELDPQMKPNMAIGLSFYKNENRKIMEQAVKDLMEYRKPYDLTLELTTARGNIRWVRTTGVPEVKNGKLIRISGFMQDVTIEMEAREKVKQLTASLEKRVEERTEQLNKSIHELEAFTYSVSHDLRTPLRAIDGFSAILDMEHGNQLNEDARRIIGIIRHNAQKMGILIDELLTFSRLGRAEITRRTIPMTEIVRSVYEELLIQEERNKYTLNLGELHHARADSLMIRQVWMNLLSNAFKFSRNRPCPVIDVSSEVREQELVFHIRDNGAGFDMKYYSKLFGVFQRLHTEKEFEGTGVGLAIVHQVITRHGGKVWAEGRVNEGAQFSFSLPMVPEV